MLSRIAALLFLFAAPAGADELQLLDHSELALSRLYRDISEAQESIDLTYFIWNPCSSVSKVLVKKLAEKAKARPKPVRVRLLLDAIPYSDDIGAIHNYFVRNGIDVKFVNPSYGPIPGNDRTHSKLALIDKKVRGKARLITGGRNISDEYFGMANENYVDRDVAVNGPSSAEDKRGTIAQAEDGFERLWSNRLSKRASFTTEQSMKRVDACTRWTARDAKLERHLKANMEKSIATERQIACSNVKFTIDDMSHVGAGGPAEYDRDGQPVFPNPELRHRSKPTTMALLGYLRGVNRSLTMENQYYIPDNPLKSILREKRAANVRIELYSNMFDGPMEMVTQWHTRYMHKEHRGSQTNHSNFRVAGLLDRWAMSPAETKYRYHSKAFTSDGKDAVISSFNIDPRSVHINGESALLVKNCPAFASRLEQVVKMSGRMWTLEENLALCQGQERPQPNFGDPFNALVQFITKDLQ
jgi:putative cardiolipin synthase